MTDGILKWIGEVVAVGGPSAVIAFGLLKWLGQKWIDQSLSIKLETFKVCAAKGTGKASASPVKPHQSNSREGIRGIA